MLIPKNVMSTMYKFLALSLFIFVLFSVSLYASAETTVSYTRVSKIEITDSKTGDIYCMWVKNGLWHQVKATCDSAMVAKMGAPADSDSETSIQPTSTSASVQSQLDSLSQQLSNQQKQIDALKISGSASTTTQNSASGSATVSKNALESVIALAQSKTETNYTADSWQVLQTALTAAVALNANPLAIQTDADAATTNLDNALAQLSPVNGSSDSLLNTTSSTNNGSVSMVGRSHISNSMASLLDIVKDFLKSIFIK